MAAIIKATPAHAPAIEQNAAKKANEIRVDLPGGATLDTGLVDRAVQELNRVYQAKGIETARAVAKVVIDAFFAGNVDEFNARKGTHISFAELKKRSDLRVSYQFVWNSCAVYDQLRVLPESLASELPLAHQKLLIPVKDADQKVALARAAVEENLSKRELEERIKQLRSVESKSGSGRPPLPAFARAFTVVKRAVAIAAQSPLDENSFVSLSKEEVRTQLDGWDQQVKELADIVLQLRSLVDDKVHGGSDGSRAGTKMID